VITLYAGAIEVLGALADKAVPPLSLEEVVALVYLYVGRRSNARFAAEVVALSCAPLVRAIGWTTERTPPERAWRCVVLGMQARLRIPFRSCVHEHARRVARETPMLRDWERQQRLAHAREVVQAIHALRRLRRLAIRRELLTPSDRAGVLTELVYGQALGSRSRRSVVYFDRGGHLYLDERTLLRRLARANRHGAAPPAAHLVSVRALEGLERPDVPARRMPHLRPPLRLLPETPPADAVEDVVGARRFDPLRLAADRVEQMAKTVREREFLATFVLDDVVTTKAAGEAIGVSESTAGVMAWRLRKRLRGKKLPPP
jgi:hypothetical protein